MWTRHKWVVSMVVLLAAVAACSDDDDDGTGTDTEFEATLSGAEEVPAVSTTATGSATISIEEAEIAYQVDVQNITNVVVSHIHVAPEGQIGPVRMDLCGTPTVPACTEGTGTLVSGSNGITMGITFDSLVAAIRAGNAYVNVHTSDGDETPDEGPGDFPGGEIRGQLTPE
jgi:hypothetical protein